MNSLKELRRNDSKWKIALVSGPNLGIALRSVPDFEGMVAGWAADLGVEVEHFHSNHEGELLEFVHASSARVNGYLVNPGGLTKTGESLRHCLKDAKVPAVEVHWDNKELLGDSIMAPTATSIFSGLGHLAVLGALTSLVLALDDMDFLHPDGVSEFNRGHGAPRSLYQ